MRVSVALSREQLAAISEAASREEMSTSEFLRRASLGRRRASTASMLISVSGPVQVPYLLNRTGTIARARVNRVIATETA